MEATAQLGRSYIKIQKFGEALDAQKKVLIARQDEYEKDAELENANIWAYLSSMDDIANLYSEIDELLPNALNMRKKVVRLARDHFGYLHSVTFKALNKLLNCEAAFPDRACREIQERRGKLLADQKAFFQADDPIILKTLSFLADDFEISGQIARAVEIRRDLLASQNALLGPENRETVDNIKRLALLLPRLQNVDSPYEEAIDLLEGVKNVQERLLGPTNFQLLDTQTHLCTMQRQLQHGTLDSFSRPDTLIPNQQDQALSVAGTQPATSEHSSMARETSHTWSSLSPTNSTKYDWIRQTVAKARQKVPLVSDQSAFPDETNSLVL
ncbi:hypothetical protein CGLO_11291 [Colletotrichum gloeosporioides Cg-14]|uniref:Uncharacterized protein n=1 Tax=Colletotrichum gloeosporioides (strain Cg-14) TaxID=1237896 RepID=T0KBF2_COLGC|nr:hypothetical protein CGLO_11291 [Colletotrichum gloeosporioides Cg-14]